jgi:hypothetical protein
VFVLERRHIEGRSASAIAQDLADAFARFCGSDAEVPAGAPERPAAELQPGGRSDLPPTFRSIL